MSADTRNIVQNSEIVQDTMADSNTVDASGDVLGYSTANQGWLKVLRWVIGLSKMLGETSRRHGATKFNGADVVLTGTITSSGVTVTGSGTAFTTELAVGDFISGTANEYREVSAIASDTSLTIVTSFSVDIVSGQAFKRITTLAERLDLLNALRGQILGEIVFNTTLLPPSVKAGAYEVRGKSIRVTADTALALTDVIGASKAGFDTYCWNWLVSDDSGNFKYVLAADAQIATGAITSITIVAGTATLDTGSAHGLSVGHIVTISGTGVNDGKYKVLTTPTGSTLTYTTTSVTNTGAVGTWTGRARITTSHGTGTPTNINTDASIVLYTPNPTFNQSLNGYYLDQYGDVTTSTSLAVYRILGCFFTDVSPVTSASTIVSHKNGFNKNDNYAEGDATISTTVTAGSVYRYAIPTRFTKLWGSDYTATDDGTNGFRCTANRRISIYLSFMSQVSILNNTGSNSLAENGTTKNFHTFSSGTVTGTSTVPIFYNGILSQSDYIDARRTIDSGQTMAISRAHIKIDM